MAFEEANRCVRDIYLKSKAPKGKCEDQANQNVQEEQFTLLLVPRAVVLTKGERNRLISPPVQSKETLGGDLDE